MTARITAAEAVALRNAATPGPWTATGPSFGFHVIQHGPGSAGSICGFPANASYNSHNAALIARAPDLVDALVAVEAENVRLRETLADVCDILHDDPGGADAHGVGDVPQRAAAVMAELADLRLRVPQ